MNVVIDLYNKFSIAGYLSWNNRTKHFLTLVAILLIVPMCSLFECDCEDICSGEEQEVDIPDQQSIIDSLETLYEILKNIKSNFPDADTSDIEAQIEHLENLLKENTIACIPFYSVVIVRWDTNTLTVINNPSNNGGYDFTNARYQWFRNGSRLRNANDQSLTRNPEGGSLQAGNYHVEITYSGGFIRTCTEWVAFGVTGN